jgi:sugar/nucleoside kinase (ribokinase family)
MGDWEGVEIFEPTCRVERIVSAAGSGDCAIAGFLAALLHGEPPAWCMAALAAVGAQNLSALDTVSGVLSWEETIAQVEGEPVKNPVPERLAALVKRDARAAD